MKNVHLVLVALAAVLATSCALQQAKTEIPEKAPAAKAPAAKEIAKKEAAAREAAAKEAAAREAAAKEAAAKEVGAESAVANVPMPGIKFAKLKSGMTLNQVEKLIGTPDRQWRHPTEKASIAFYFGPDRWVIKYAYKGEGVLTFNSGGEQLLTNIEVNKAE